MRQQMHMSFQLWSSTFNAVYDILVLVDSVYLSGAKSYTSTVHGLWKAENAF
jgi:hypothetical protein